MTVRDYRCRRRRSSRHSRRPAVAAAAKCGGDGDHSGPG